MRRRVSRISAAVLLLGGIGVACAAQDRPALVVSSDPDLAELASRLLPDLARRSGMELRAPVRLERRSREELVRYLDDTEVGNGFANRFLWLCVRRARVLPEGGRLQEADLSSLIDRLKAAIDFSSGVREMQRDKEAKGIWWSIYEKLSEGKPGLFGALISRAEAQVMRVACAYALLDLSEAIRASHLLAALALWDYSEASVRFIFGDRLGDPVADTILKAVREAPDGLTRTAISDLFGRHESTGRISRALTSLEALGQSRRTTEETGGRPVERWYKT